MYSRQSVVEEQHACLQNPNAVQHALFGEEIDLGTISPGIHLILRQEIDVFPRRGQGTSCSLRCEVEADNGHGIKSLILSTKNYEMTVEELHTNARYMR